MTWVFSRKYEAERFQTFLTYLTIFVNRTTIVNKLKNVMHSYNKMPHQRIEKAKMYQEFKADRKYVKYTCNSIKGIVNFHFSNKPRPEMKRDAGNTSKYACAVCIHYITSCTRSNLVKCLTFEVLITELVDHESK